ncbi:MAG: hypothetical protein AAF799_33720 [Myxococcota bacterium]
MRAALHSLGLLGCLMACNCFLFGGSEPQNFGPEPDCQGCENPSEFELDPTCELMGDLDVTLGQGADEFQTLAGSPVQYSGPQGGGGHSFIALRIGGIDPAHYDRVEVTLTYFQDDECLPEDVPCEDGGFDERLVLGGDQPWRMVDGNVEEYGIRMFFDDWGSSALQAVVRDPCGQEGFALHQWDGYEP